MGARMSSALAVLALVLNATTWGLAWWPIRLLTEAGLHPLWATAMIYVAATAGLVLVIRSRLAAGLRQSRGLWWLVLASGLTNASFNWAVTLTDVARVALLFYLMPVWAALLARWLLKEPLTWLVVVRICRRAGGRGVRVPGSARASRAHGSWMADALAVTAGMTFAVNTVMLRKVAGQSRAAIALAMFSGGGADADCWSACCCPSPVTRCRFRLRPGLWIGLVALTAAAYMLGNLALQYGAARLPANTTSLIMLTEVGRGSGVWRVDRGRDADLARAGRRRADRDRGRVVGARASGRRAKQARRRRWRVGCAGDVAGQPVPDACARQRTARASRHDQQDDRQRGAPKRIGHAEHRRIGFVTGGRGLEDGRQEFVQAGGHQEPVGCCKGATGGLGGDEMLVQGGGETAQRRHACQEAAAAAPRDWTGWRTAKAGRKNRRAGRRGAG